jgi:hypothetical protein
LSTESSGAALLGRAMTRRHVWIDDADWEWITETFGSNLGTSKAIRMMIKTFRRGVESRAGQGARRPQIDASAQAEIEALASQVEPE